MAKKFLVTDNWKLTRRMLRINLNGSEYAYELSRAVCARLARGEVNGATVYMVFEDAKERCQLKGFFELEAAKYHLVQRIAQSEELYEVECTVELEKAEKELLQFLFEEFLKNRA